MHPRHLLRALVSPRCAGARLVSRHALHPLHWPLPPGALTWALCCQSWAQQERQGGSKREAACSECEVAYRWGRQPLRPRTSSGPRAVARGPEYRSTVPTQEGNFCRHDVSAAVEYCSIKPGCIPRSSRNSFTVGRGLGSTEKGKPTHSHAVFSCNSLGTKKKKRGGMGG